jgi:glycosyltransferase involved in cell wall biosynthesis
VHTVPLSRGTPRDLASMARSLVTGVPFLIVRDDRAAMRRLVERVAAERFDVVHADQLNMAQYAERVPGAARILDAHNALWVVCKRLWETMRPGPKKWMLGRDWRLLQRYEGRICRTFDAVLAVSEPDKAGLEEAAGDAANITVIPIAIDTQEVTWLARRPDASRIVHIGTMFWPPNIDGVLWFLREVWPLIRAQRPDAAFDAVGANPPPQIVGCGANTTGVHVNGHVADTTPILERAAVMVVPLRAGGGIRVKILTALAQGIPVVSTSLGAEGIAVTPGQNILVADTPAAFAAAVLRLLDSPEYGARLAADGRRLVEARYDYRSACKPLDAVYASAVRSRTCAG